MREVRLIFIGDEGVGKTSILTRYLFKEWREGAEAPEVENIIHVNRKLRCTTVEVNLSDASLDYRIQRMKTVGLLSKLHYSFLMVYDVSSLDSFVSLAKWLERIEIHLGLEAKRSCLVIGNKTDVESGDRRVTYTQAKEWLRTQGLTHYIETSAKAGTNVKAAVDKAIDLALKKQQFPTARRVEMDTLHHTKPPTTPSTSSKSCCLCCCCIPRCCPRRHHRVEVVVVEEEGVDDDDETSSS